MLGSPYIAIWACRMTADAFTPRLPPYLQPRRPGQRLVKPLTPEQEGTRVYSEEHRRLVREGIDPPLEHFVDEPVTTQVVRRTSWTSVELLAEVFPDPRWAVAGIVAEGLNLLAGPPKLGKSWFALDIAVAVAAGGKALGHIDVELGDALYLALEDPPRRMQDRTRKVLAGSPPSPRLTIGVECDAVTNRRSRPHWPLACRTSRRAARRGRCLRSCPRSVRCPRRPIRDGLPGRGRTQRPRGRVRRRHPARPSHEEGRRRRLARHRERIARHCRRGRRGARPHQSEEHEAGETQGHRQRRGRGRVRGRARREHRRVAAARRACSRDRPRRDPTADPPSRARRRRNDADAHRRRAAT